MHNNLIDDQSLTLGFYSQNQYKIIIVKRILIKLIICISWIIFITGITFSFRLSPPLGTGMITVSDILKMIEPYVSAIINMSILLDINQINNESQPLLLMTFAIITHVFGNDTHLYATYFKRSIIDTNHDYYVWLRVVLEHLVGHYIYLVGLGLEFVIIILKSRYIFFRDYQSEHTSIKCLGITITILFASLLTTIVCLFSYAFYILLPLLWIIIVLYSIQHFKIRGLYFDFTLHPILNPVLVSILITCIVSSIVACAIGHNVE